jgi:hypothetical protein
MTKAGTVPFAFTCLPTVLIAVYPEDNKKPINTLRGKKSASLKVEADGIYNNHCRLQGYFQRNTAKSIEYKI